jgi:hypothetical protein
VLGHSLAQDQPDRCKIGRQAREQDAHENADPQRPVDGVRVRQVKHERADHEQEPETCQLQGRPVHAAAPEVVPVKTCRKPRRSMTILVAGAA